MSAEPDWDRNIGADNWAIIGPMGRITEYSVDGLAMVDKASQLPHYTFFLLRLGF
jgi:hypothetical protein